MSGRLDELSSRSADGDVHIVVEPPRGAASKFKFEPSLNAITLSRPLPAGVVYPYDWGFIPSTCAEDGDALDATAPCRT